MSLTRDRDVVLAAALQNIEALDFADEGLLRDRDFVLALHAKVGWAALRRVDGILEDDNAFVALALQGKPLPMEPPETDEDDSAYDLYGNRDYDY
mmetsp:Transcript_5112/g.16077  ORF Transcript_5112/g.16077 Transcript_5112/m.16077 type:complete len:95 (-) Transcript_5112:223-507(-)